MRSHAECVLIHDLRGRFGDLEGKYPDPSAPSFPGWIASPAYDMAVTLTKGEVVGVVRDFLAGRVNLI